MKKTSKTRAANVPVPQSREEAAQFIRQIGDAQRAVTRIETTMNDRIAKIQEAANAQADLEKTRIAALTEGVRIYCEANRDALTQGGKTKTADLGTGIITWRIRPPKVNARGLEAIIARFKELGLTRFIRVKEDLDKEAMLKEPAEAVKAPGVTIGSEGEDFAVEPLNIELSAEGQAA